jgi:hypothetical protein
MRRLSLLILLMSLSPLLALGRPLVVDRLQLSETTRGADAFRAREIDTRQHASG